MWYDVVVVVIVMTRTLQQPHTFHGIAITVIKVDCDSNGSCRRPGNSLGMPGEAGLLRKEGGSEGGEEASVGVTQ